VIAYLTHDEVNARFASRAAHKLGLDLTVLPVKDGEQAVAADMLLLDLDHLPPDFKADLLQRAESGRLRGGVAVHSYQLSPPETQSLQRAGALVACRLTAGLIAASAASSRQSDGSVVPHPL